MSTSAPIKRAIVQKLRATPALVSAIRGGIHEGIAPRRVEYPFIVYQLVAAPYAYDWSGATLQTIFDVFVFAVNPVDANNIDALITGAERGKLRRVDVDAESEGAAFGDLVVGLRVSLDQAGVDDGSGKEKALLFNGGPVPSRLVAPLGATSAFAIHLARVGRLAWAFAQLEMQIKL